MKFKKDAKVSSSDMYYDLFDGGYIEPEKLLTDKKEAKKVREAIETVRQYLNEAEKTGVLEIM